MRRALAGALVALPLACASKPAVVPTTVVDDGLAAQLPGGAEAVVDIDVAQWRAWPGGRQLREPAARLDALGVHFLADVDRAAIGAGGLGGDAPSATVLLRGRLPADRMRAALGGEAGDYHGRTVVDGGERSLALLDADTVALGPPAEVRRAVDVALGGDEGMARDRATAALLARLPTAKQGRPAAIGLVHVGPALATALEKAGVPAPPRWLGAAVALGDGVDVGVVAGAADPAAAAALDQWLRGELQSLKSRPSLRALGLAPFVDVVRTATRNEELHLAWRLEQRRLDVLLSRAARLWQTAEAAQ